MDTQYVLKTDLIGDTLFIVDDSDPMKPYSEEVIVRGYFSFRGSPWLLIETGEGVLKEMKATSLRTKVYKR